MLTKNELKFLKSLHQKKNREEAKLFWAEGEKLVAEAIHSEFAVKEIFIQNNIDFKVPQNMAFRQVSAQEMNQISGFDSPPGVMALIHYPETQNINIDSLSQKSFLLIDRMNDPGNLGTLIRTADWFGIDTVFCTRNTVDCFNEKVVQASMGSIFRVQIFYLDLNEFITELNKKNIPVYTAAMDGKKAEHGFMKYGGLLLGNESHGVDPELQKLKTIAVTIPSNGKAESLNVGVAGGILMSMISK